MEKVISQAKIKMDKETHKTSETITTGEPLKDEGYIERQLFFNILKQLKGDVTLLELGAGRGDWCLALTGIVDFNLIDTDISSYKCIAVEAEPTHYEWTKAHFEEQGIKGAQALHGAISSKNGECKFYSTEDPASTYGQAITENGNLTVPCYTVDYLIDKYSLSKVDIVHVDIQGAEYDMLLGATEALSKGTIKYMLIGTHSPDMNEKIIEYVKPFHYKAVFSANCNSGAVDTPFGRANIPVDGILLLKHENS
jgi:hypothetical protein